MGRQRRVGFHHAGDFIDGDFRVNPQAHDFAHALCQRRYFNGGFKPLLNASRREGLDCLGDGFAVVVRAVQVEDDLAQRLTKAPGVGHAQQAQEVFAGDFQQQARLPRADQQQRLLQQLLFVQARRTGNGRQTRQLLQAVAVEYLAQPALGNGGHATPDQVGQAVEVKQLALGEHHHQGASGVIEQHGLDLTVRVEPRMIEDFSIGNRPLSEQLLNNRWRARNGEGNSDFTHGLHPMCATQI